MNLWFIKQVICWMLCSNTRRRLRKFTLNSCAPLEILVIRRKTSGATSVDQYAQVCQGRADKPDVAAAVNSDPRQIKWTRELLADPGRLRHHGSGTMFTNRNLLFRASIVRFRSSGFISIAASNRIRETSYTIGNSSLAPSSRSIRVSAESHFRGRRSASPNFREASRSGWHSDRSSDTTDLGRSTRFGCTHSRL